MDKFEIYGLLRISNVTVPSNHTWDTVRILTRGDVRFTATGCVLRIRHSKTIQYQERVFEAVIPRLPDNPLCPSLAICRFMQQAGNLPTSAPALAFTQPSSGKMKTITPPQARSALHRLISAIGLNTSDYNTHSLRRSGATHLLSLGVPFEIIKILGDWKSDCVFKYLKPNAETKLSMLPSVSSLQ